MSLCFVFLLDIFSTPSAETTVPINEKIEITTPTLKPTNQTISTISPTLTGSNSTVVKIQVEKLQPEVVVKENKGDEKSKIEIKVEKLTPSGKDEIQVEKVTPAPSETGENTGDTVSVEKVSAGEETKQAVAEESIRGKIQVTKIATGSAPVEKVDEISVEKVQIEQKEEQKEEEKGASAESVVVEEVERKKESEEKPPAHISVKKTANDEELDLEVEGIRKNKPYISVEKISPDDRQTNVKKKETSKKSIVVEKIIEEANKKETKPLIQISVEKMKNEEDLDLAIGNTKKSNNKETVISVEEVSPTEKATEVKVKLTPTTVSVEVEKVNEVEEDNRPNEITAKKVQNDDEEDQGKETEESEEEDLETGAVGKGNTKSEKAKQALVKEEKKKTNTISVQVTEQKASNDESEEKSLNLERRDMINNEKEKEDKSVVKKSEENVKVAVKKVKLVQPRINTGSRNNQDIKQEAAEEDDLQMKPQMETSPAESDKAQSKKVEKVQSATPSDEDVLDDANDNRDEEKELEDEQEVLTEKETPEERKIAQAFDKALDKERNKARNMKTEAPTTHSSIPTTKKQSTKTRETGPQKERVKPSSKAKSKGDLSIEELELAALAEKTLNEDDTKEAKVFVSTQTSPTTAVKEKKNPEATVAVTKETTKPLLSGKETAKEEKKLKEELAIETKLEKTGVSVKSLICFFKLVCVH